MEFPAKVILSLALAVPVVGAENSTTGDEFFEMRIRPLLANNCFTCHAELRMGGLRLDSKESLLKGGNSGAAVLPGKPDQSLLVRAVSYNHDRLKMPPQGKLKNEEISDLVAWVKMGAPWPESKILPGAVSKGKDGVISLDRRRFWAFRAVSKPPLPQVKNKEWAKSSIDYFVLATLEARGIRPVKAADKRTLIRRATFDLIGLPPRAEEVDAFQQDSSPKGFAKVVDRLLASPHYGERWGRYWLDVARYGEDDSHGFGGPHANAFRYRDWVVQAFNDDMPYDLFVKAQIAADLLERPDRERLMPGLGLFALGPRYQIMEEVRARAEENHDRIDVLTRGFLALTVACSRCHDHKFDPVSVKDYYGLAGVFASSEYREFPLAPEDVVKQFNDHKKKIHDQDAAIREFLQLQTVQLSEILARQTSKYMVAAWKVWAESQTPSKVAEDAQLDRETLERWVVYLAKREREHPHLQDWDALNIRTASFEAVKRAADEFQARLLSTLKEKKDLEERNRVLRAQVENKGYCKDCSFSLLTLERNKYVLWQEFFDKIHSVDGVKPPELGVFLYPDEKVERFLHGEWEHLKLMRAELQALKESSPPPYPWAHALADSQKPGNIRINLRGNPENLGEETPRRFLAVLSEGQPLLLSKGSGRLELAEAIANTRNPLTARVISNRIWQHHFGSGIVRTSSNFGLQGERPSHPELLDYLASRLMEGNWSIKALHREIMLSATYQLSSDFSQQAFGLDPDNRLLWRMNRQRLDAEALRDSLLFVAGDLDLTLGGPPAGSAIEHKRRTLYSRVSRHKLDTLLGLFDFPDPSISSESRIITNGPLQQLFFLNSGFISDRAKKLEEVLNGGAGDPDSAKIRKAYRLLFGRRPSELELRTGLDFLLQTHPAASDSPSGWHQYIQALLSSNEFSFVD